MSPISNVLNTISESLSRGKFYQINRLIGLIICSISIGLTVNAAPADLDPTFGNGGKVISSPDGSQSTLGYGMALQADGKIVRVGTKNPSTAGGAVVARYNSDGSLDTTFGNNGWTSITYGGDRETASSVAIQADGKIVIGGQTILPGGNQDLSIARFNSDGSLDTTFSDDGKVTVGFTSPNGGNTIDWFGSLKVGNDGKIVFGGEYSGFNTSYINTIGRLNSDGSLDSTFGTGGKVVGGNATGVLNDLIVQPDGSIVTAGNVSNQTNSLMLAIKYNNNGSQGWVYSQYQDFGVPIGLYGITAQTDGKVIIVGSKAGKISVTRLTSTGGVDASFSQSTILPDGRGRKVTVQPDGKVVVTASVSGVVNGGFSLIRFNSDGTLDTSFGIGGIVSTDSVGGINEVIIQPDGKILAGGATNNYFTTVRYIGGNAVPINTNYDFDGDERTDFVIFRPTENKWYILKSSDFTVIQTVFGTNGDILVPADFDGDAKTDLSIFRPSTGHWWYQSSIDNIQRAVQWGQAGDIPRPSDFDGDGKADFVIYRPSETNWYRYGSTGQVSVNQFGSAGDKPLIADFDGDGKSDLAIFRPSTGDWWWQSSVDNIQRAVHWGIATDLPTPADYDGDGKTDLAVFRPSEGGWYIAHSSNNTIITTAFGLNEDKPISADYDGDGRADIGVYRPSNGIWYMLQTTSGFGGLQWGNSSDTPIPNAFIQ